MAEGKEKSWVQKILPGWFKEEEDPPDQQVQSGQARAEPSPAGQVPRDVSSLTGVSQTTSTITGKLATLKKTLEFDGNVKSDLNAIGSAQELLLYVYDVLVLKFSRLHEIGLLSTKSTEAVGLISRKIEAVLADQYAEKAPGAEHLEVLKAEHEALKKRFEALQAKHLQTGVITEREIQFEKECNYLKARIRELDTFLRVAQKKISILTATADMVQSLRAKNSLLNLKVEHQTRLLKTLTKDQAESQELLAAVDRLTTENTQLKGQIEKQGGILEQLKGHTFTDPAVGSLLQGLIDEKAGLVAELEHKQDQLESLAVSRPEGDVLSDVERLQDENIQLKGWLQANESLSQLLSAQRDKGVESGGLADMLQNENQRLKQLLAAKKEQIKVLSSTPTNRPLVKAITRLKEEIRQLQRESDQKASYCAQLQVERKQLQERLRESLALSREAKRLKAELDSTKRLVESLRKVEFQHEALKKKLAEVRIKYEASVHENAALNKKVAKLTTEYNLLVNEYENLFGKS